MRPRGAVPQSEPVWGSELADSLDLIFEFFIGPGAAALEPILMEDCEAAIPALLLP